MNENWVDQDLYRILDVAPTASRTELAAAYRRQLRRFHLDTHTDASDATGGDADPAGALQEILAAYAVLGDPERRAPTTAASLAATAPGPGSLGPNPHSRVRHRPVSRRVWRSEPDLWLGWPHPSSREASAEGSRP